MACGGGGRAGARGVPLGQQCGRWCACESRDQIEGRSRAKPFWGSDHREARGGLMLVSVSYLEQWSPWHLEIQVLTLSPNPPEWFWCTYPLESGWGARGSFETRVELGGKAGKVSLAGYKAGEFQECHLRWQMWMSVCAWTVSGCGLSRHPVRRKAGRKRIICELSLIATEVRRSVDRGFLCQHCGHLGWTILLWGCCEL